MADQEQRSDRPVEQEAVKTTIVGGRPPGSGKAVGQVPRGIEVMLKKASVDPEFRAAFLEKRSAAAAQIGLPLTAAEKMMIDLAARSQLEGLIAGTKVEPRLAPTFLGKAAAVMLAALGVVNLSCADESKSLGIRPEEMPDDGKERAAATARPSAPEAAGDRTVDVRAIDPRGEGVAISKGIQPDRPPTTTPATTQAGEWDERYMTIAGILPPEIQKGVRADRPFPAGTADVRPEPPTTTQPSSRPFPPAVAGAMIDRPAEMDDSELRLQAMNGVRADRPPTSSPTQPSSQPSSRPPREVTKGMTADRPAEMDDSDAPLPPVAGAMADRPTTTTQPTQPSQPSSRPMPEQRGARPDRPVQPAAQMDDSDARSQIVEGIRADRPTSQPATTQAAEPPGEIITLGLRPDVPRTAEPTTITSPTAPATRPASEFRRGLSYDRPAEMDDTDMRTQVVDGIRPDRPSAPVAGVRAEPPTSEPTTQPATDPTTWPALSQGVRPDYPTGSEPLSRGIRPDRPTTTTPATTQASEPTEEPREVAGARPTRPPQ